MRTPREARRDQAKTMTSRPLWSARREAHRAKRRGRPAGARAGRAVGAPNRTKRAARASGAKRETSSRQRRELAESPEARRIRRRAPSEGGFTATMIPLLASSRMPPELSVVVPVRGRWPMTRECLARLREHTPQRLEVLVVDGGSPASMRRSLAALAGAWRPLRVLSVGAPATFSTAINAGLREARGAAVVWLNNDVRVGPGWSTALLRALALPGVAAAGPRTAAPGPDFDRLAAAWSLRRSAAPRTVSRLYGHCLALRREAVEAVGLLDERLVWGEEDEDYCFRLRQAGWSLVLADGALVEHRMAATRGHWASRTNRARWAANIRLMREKWLFEAARIRRDLADALAARSPKPGGPQQR
ncbi:glycosyltransferase [bacterium]|nr:MAG: glycosyltransferase [bacterium]